MDRLKVLLWSARGAGNHYGGPGRSALQLYRRAGDRVEVDLIHAFPAQECEERFGRQFDCSSAFGLSHATAKAIRNLFRVGKRYDVLHALTGFLPSLFLANAARSTDLPAVVKVAASESELRNENRSAVGAALRRSLLARTNAYIAISDEIDKELAHWGVPEGSIARIPNGVDTRAFVVESMPRREFLRSLLGVDPHLPMILFSGALVRRKRPHLLLEASLLLADRRHEFQLVFAGPALDPGYSDELRTLASRLSPRVPCQFLGHRTDMENVYGAADLFVLPTMREGMPNALLEAQSCGLPCVVTHASGIADIVDSGVNGFIEDPNPARIADRMHALMTSTFEYNEMSMAARKRMVERFDSERVVRAHLNVFQSVLKGEPVRNHGLF